MSRGLDRRRLRQREIERELKDTEIDVDADTAKARKEIKKVENGRYTAKVKVDVDQASLAKARAQLSAVGGRAGSSRSAALAKGEALTAAVGLAPNVVPLIGGVVQAVGQLSGVLGLIPAAAGAAGLAIGSLEDRHHRVSPTPSKRSATPPNSPRPSRRSHRTRSRRPPPVIPGWAGPANFGQVLQRGRRIDGRHPGVRHRVVNRFPG